jgi:hypothetical protein
MTTNQLSLYNVETGEYEMGMSSTQVASCNVYKVSDLIDLLTPFRDSLFVGEFGSSVSVSLFVDDTNGSVSVDFLDQGDIEDQESVACDLCGKQFCLTDLSNVDGVVVCNDCKNG